MSKDGCIIRVDDTAVSGAALSALHATWSSSARAPLVKSCPTGQYAAARCRRSCSVSLVGGGECHRALSHLGIFVAKAAPQVLESQ
jgi:hypothetical protein